MTMVPDPADPAGAGGGADGAPGEGSAAGGSPADGDPPTRSRGADLARQALEAARARSGGQRRRRPTPGSDTPLRLRRRRWSGPGADPARDPQPLGVTARAWLAGTGAGTQITQATLVERWEQIVGGAIADRCQPVSLRDGELVVQAESTAWATQLRLMAPQLIGRINAELGRGTVRRLRTRGPAGPSWRFGTRHVPGRGPRDTYG